MFADSPSNYYEWIEPRPVSKPDQKPSFSTFKPSKQLQSTSALHAQSASRLDDVCSDRFSFESLISKRPLPPIPNEAGNPQPERTESGLYKKYRNTSVDPLRWQSKVKGTGSKPLTRSGSEPNLLMDEKEPRLSSSQSLEFLDVVDSQQQQQQTESRSKPTTVRDTTSRFLSLPRHCRPPHQSSDISTNLGVLQQSSNREPRPSSDMTSREDGKSGSAAVRVRPPPPSLPPPPDDVVENIRATTTRISMLRRQRPVNPDIRRQTGNHHSSSAELTANITSSASQDAVEYSRRTLPVRCAIISSWLFCL